MYVFDENDFPGNSNEEIDNFDFPSFDFEFSDNPGQDVNSFDLHVDNNNTDLKQHTNTYSETEQGHFISYNTLLNNKPFENTQTYYTTSCPIPNNPQSMLPVNDKPIGHINKKRKLSDKDIQYVIKSLGRKDKLTKEEKEELRRKKMHYLHVAKEQEKRKQ
jgi:hypothetical protein